MRVSRSKAAGLSSFIIVAGCSSAPPLVPPVAPAALQPPYGQVLFIEALATGVQIYECAQKPDGSFEWAFKSPEATLAARTGEALGKHYAGPTWESTDGSTVVGDMKARDAGPDPKAIPWLLLAAKSHAGAGVMTPVQSVQRLNTVGGIAPTAACGTGNLKDVARVPYTATYYFYR